MSCSNAAHAKAKASESDKRSESGNASVLAGRRLINARTTLCATAKVPREWAKRERLRLVSQLDHLLKAELVARWQMTISDSYVQSVIERLVKRDLSPWKAVELLLNGGGS